jgi:hypothetical protein
MLLVSSVISKWVKICFVCVLRQSACGVLANRCLFLSCLNVSGWMVLNTCIWLTTPVVREVLVQTSVLLSSVDFVCGRFDRSTTVISGVSSCADKSFAFY